MLSERLTLRTGCLIDIIKTKGRSGFTAFLEVVEYEYGDLFLEITDKQPRMPPRGQIVLYSFTTANVSSHLQKTTKTASVSTFIP